MFAECGLTLSVCVCMERDRRQGKETGEIQRRRIDLLFRLCSSSQCLSDDGLTYIPKGDDRTSEECVCERHTKPREQSVHSLWSRNVSDTLEDHQRCWCDLSKIKGYKGKGQSRTPLYSSKCPLRKPWYSAWHSDALSTGLLWSQFHVDYRAQALN